MSWDVIAFGSRSREPRPAPGWKPVSLGAVNCVKEAVASSFPSLVWTDELIAFWQYTGLSFELRLETTDDASQVTMIYIRVCGNGNPLTPLVRLANANGWSLMDTTDCSWIDLETPSMETWNAFREFRHASGNTYD